MLGARLTRHLSGGGARITLLGIAAALATGIALAGSASAAWLPAKTVATGPVFTSDVAVSPDGVATVVWGYEGEPGVHARRFGPGGAPLGPSFQIGDGDESMRSSRSPPLTVPWSSPGGTATSRARGPSLPVGSIPPESPPR